MKLGNITFKIFALIVLNDIGDTLAQAFMKKGLMVTGISSVNFTNLAEFLIKGIGSPFLWLGILFFVLNFFVWIVILYKVDLSIAMPVGSFAYVLIPIAAMIFFHEKVNFLRWVGIALIILGIHFVSKSKKVAPSGRSPE